MSESKPRIICPACGAVLRWLPEAAGRKVPCQCGALLRYPKEPGGEVNIERPSPPKTPDPVPQPRAAEPPSESPADELVLPDELKLDEDFAMEGESLDLDLPETEKAAPAAGGCPSCGKPVKPGAVICMACGYNLKSGEKIKTALGEEDADAKSDAAGRPSVLGKITGIFSRTKKQERGEEEKK